MNNENFDIKENYHMPLTDEQKKVINSIKDNKLILAGPGTGKSFTILGHIKHLVKDKNIAPDKIFVLTFTRAATQELKTKISRKLRDEDNLPQVFTLHGFALRQLMKNLNRITYLPSNFSIADDFEERHIIMEDLKRYLKISKIKEVKNLFNLLSSNWETLNADRTGWESSFQNPEFLGAWKEHREIYGYILRSELVYQFKKALDEIEDLKIDGPIEYLIVDEYQDLNRCDLKTIRILNSKGSKLLVAGDDDQSIYGFRYAYPEGIKNFCDEVSNSEQFAITECYRCDSEILSLAMNVIKQDFRRLPKTIKSVTGNTGSVKLLKFATQDEEAKKVAEIIERLKNTAQYEDSDFLILLRSDFNNAFSKVIIEACDTRGITVNKGLQYDVFDSQNGRLFVGIVKYISNNQNDLAVRSILSNTKGIGEVLIDSIYLQAKNDNIRFNEIVHKIVNGAIQDIKYSDKVISVIEKLSDISELIKKDEKSFAEIIESILAFIGDESFSEAIRKLIENTDIDSIDSLIFFVTDLLGPAEPAEENFFGVRIMSMHQAKGLTAKVVFIVALEDEYIPGKGDIDEERRLLYVSLTRAKHYLFMTFCNKRTGQQQHSGYLKYKTQYRNLSRFISDIPGIERTDRIKY